MEQRHRLRPQSMGAAASTSNVGPPESAAPSSAPVAQTPARTADAPFEVSVVTRARVPVCKVRVVRSDSIAAILEKVARTARLPERGVRLSLRGEVLEPSGRVSAYGLQAGDEIMMHAKQVHSIFSRHHLPLPRTPHAP